MRIPHLFAFQRPAQRPAVDLQCAEKVPFSSFCHCKLRRAEFWGVSRSVARSVRIAREDARRTHDPKGKRLSIAAVVAVGDRAVPAWTASVTPTWGAPLSGNPHAAPAPGWVRWPPRWTIR